MALAWNEIKDRALAFSRDWAKAESEDADAKPFWIDFFNVFGINQRRIGSFEQKVKKLGDRDGYIDWLWKGNLLIEHKSRGKDLDRTVDAAYGKKSFASEAERVAFLFERYQAITSLLPAAAPRKPGKKTTKQPDHDPLP